MTKTCNMKMLNYLLIGVLFVSDVHAQVKSSRCPENGYKFSLSLLCKNVP